VSEVLIFESRQFCAQARSFSAVLGRLDMELAAPAISPDGLKIAFMLNRDGDIEIYSMDIDARRLPA